MSTCNSCDKKIVGQYATVDGEIMCMTCYNEMNELFGLTASKGDLSKLGGTPAPTPNKVPPPVAARAPVASVPSAKGPPTVAPKPSTPYFVAPNLARTRELGDKTKQVEQRLKETETKVNKAAASNPQVNRVADQKKKSDLEEQYKKKELEALEFDKRIKRASVINVAPVVTFQQASAPSVPSAPSAAEKKN